MMEIKYQNLWQKNYNRVHEFLVNCFRWNIEVIAVVLSFYLLEIFNILYLTIFYEDWWEFHLKKKYFQALSNACSIFQHFSLILKSILKYINDCNICSKIYFFYGSHKCFMCLRIDWCYTCLYEIMDHEWSWHRWLIFLIFRSKIINYVN